MKQILRCFSCNTLTAKYQMYRAKFTGLIEMPQAPGIKQFVEKHEVHLCRNCCDKCGYVVRAEKKHKERKQKVKEISEKPKSLDIGDLLSRKDSVININKEA